MPHKAFLLVSLSGRVLAKAAARAQRPAVGVDAFADRDTRAYALEWTRVALDHDWKVDAAALRAAVDEICPVGHCLGLVYGSGLEAEPDLLRDLARSRPLLGNAPEVLEGLASPIGFAELAGQLGIPHPDTSAHRPASPDGWLRKRAGACGGAHVAAAGSSQGGDAGHYFQRQLFGQEGSLLFLANGRDICPIGFNRPLPPPPEAPAPWIYSGAVRQARGPENVAQEILAAAATLTRRLGLVGLNGIDFMLTGRGWSLLELNPRPTATVELWDRPPMPPLFDLHVQACHGRLPVHPTRPAGATAVAVAYAPRRLRVPPAFPWPSWCADLPPVGQDIAPGQPICSVRADGHDGDAAAQLVHARRGEFLDRLARCQGLEPDGHAGRMTGADLITNLSMSAP